MKGLFSFLHAQIEAKGEYAVLGNKHLGKPTGGTFCGENKWGCGTMHFSDQ